MAHRDLSSSNVLVRADGTCALCDFGSSTILRSFSGHHYSQSRTRNMEVRCRCSTTYLYFHLHLVLVNSQHQWNCKAVNRYLIISVHMCAKQPVSVSLHLQSHFQFGTLRYMPPEILQGSVNLRNTWCFMQGDIYALALLLWEIWMRCADLFEGKTP